MSRSFEELARADTPLGEIVLRRRLEPISQRDIHEVILAGDGLMSSLFTHGEEQLAELGLAAVLADRLDGLDVVVGGLGLGYTARTVLQDARVRTLHVVDTLDVVIDWHQRHLVPVGAELTDDPRCTLTHGDFFALVDQDPPMLHAGAPTHFDAILADIDHSPRHLLDPGHAALYTPNGLRRLGRHLRPHGVFALWSNDPPDDEFLADLRTCFADADAHVISFWNFLVDDHTRSTIYVAVDPLR
ncbi:MAG TPA: spermidine synthase [Ilumatobacteraceae bacterium]|nr:spermidine synthase [Ilumatobacteraceae bacterium]